MEDAKAKLDRFHSHATGTMEKLRKVFEFLAIAEGIKKFGEAIHAAAEQADRLDNLAQKTGIAAASLSSLEIIARHSGVGIEALASGLVKFDKAISDAVGGAKEQATAFKLLGLSQEELKKSSPEQVLARVADQFAKFADGPNKDALALAVFGKAGADLIPILNQGGEALAAQRQEIEKLGLALDEQGLKKLTDFNKTLNKAGDIAVAFRNHIAIGMAPALDKLLKSFTDGAADVDKFADVEARAAAGGQVLASGFVVLSHVITGTGTALGIFVAAWSKFLEGASVDLLLNPITAPFEQIRLAAKNGAATIAILKEGGKDLTSGLSDELTSFNDVWKKTADGIKASGEKIKEAASKTDAPNLTGALEVGKQTEANRKAVEDFILALEKKQAGELQATKVEDLYGQSLKGTAEAQYAVYRAEVEASEQFKKANVEQRKKIENDLAAGEALARQKDQIAQARDIYEQTRTPLEKLNVELERLKRLTATDTNGKPLVDDDTKARYNALVQLTPLREKYNKIVSDEALQEERIRNSQEVGARSEIDAMQAIGDERSKAVAELELLIDTYEKLAIATKNTGLADEAARARVELEKLKGEADVVGNQFRSELKSDFETAFTTIIENVHNAGDAFRQFFDSIASYLTKLAAQQLAQALVGGGGSSGQPGLLDTLFSLFSAAGSSGGGGLNDPSTSGFVGPTRATGGPVAANEPYWVGERGPEMFVPSGAGRIVPSEKSMGGHTSVNLNVYGVTDADSFKRSQAQILSNVGTAVQRARQRNG